MQAQQRVAEPERVSARARLQVVGTTGRGLVARFTTPSVLARIVALIGVVTVLSAVSPALQGRVDLLTHFLPGVFPAAATAGAMVVGSLMVVGSRGVRRGKRGAWALALAVGSVVLDLVKGLDVEEAVAAALLAVLLWLGRSHFSARPDPRSLRDVVRVLLAGPVVATILGTLWLGLHRHHQVPGTTWWDRVQSAAAGLIGFSGPVRFLDSASATRAAIGLAVLGAGVLLAVLLALFRPASGPGPMDEEDELQVRETLESWGGGDSLSYFATRADRSVVWDPHRRAAVSHRVVGSVSLAAGDPLGDPTAWPEAIWAWQGECARNGWTPAVLGASEAGALAHQRAGLDALELGDEAVLDTTTFTLEGRPMRGVRQAVSRCQREGVEATVHRVGDLSVEQRARIRDRAQDWRDGVERGYSMALDRVVDVADPDSVVVLARDSGSGRLVGMLGLVPWGADGLSLDLMRRDRSGVNGVIELMVATLCADAGELGVRRVSLNFAVFRAVFARGDQIGAGPVLRLWCRVLRVLSRFWQIESLYRSNDKYRPDWVPRFLCFRTAGDLPRIATAALRAESFLVLPSPRMLWWGWQEKRLAQRAR